MSIEFFMMFMKKFFLMVVLFLSLVACSYKPFTLIKQTGEYRYLYAVKSEYAHDRLFLENEMRQLCAGKKKCFIGILHEEDELAMSYLRDGSDPGFLAIISYAVDIDSGLPEHIFYDCEQFKDVPDKGRCSLRP